MDLSLTDSHENGVKENGEETTGAVDDSRPHNFPGPGFRDTERDKRRLIATER